ncbi:DUF814 domain-containing protein [Candidatus Micrarchaeota archaeon]|nr:DUF814 domain-containing protein [Candidatus Micrarchaeota archaeon]
MKIVIDLKKTVHENAAIYYDEAKKWKKKAEGARIAIAQMQGRSLAKASDRRQAPVTAATKPRKVKAGWFGEYQHAYTKNGFLVVCGKNAKQNDQLVSRHLKEGDLFFHADIVGASATLLKGAGKTPAREDLEQAAQMAACYSRAWKQGYHVVDVYAVSPSQVTKYSQGEYVGQGAFIISGERLWFRNTQLKLYLQPDAEQKTVAVLPVLHQAKADGLYLAQPGQVKKEDACKQLARKFKVREEALLSVLPGDVAAV